MQASGELARANAGLAPTESSRLVAGLALRLAQLGEAEKVSLTVRGTRQAAEMVLSFLDERRRAEAPKSSNLGPRTPQGENGGDNAVGSLPGPSGSFPKGSPVLAVLSEGPLSGPAEFRGLP